MATTAMVEAYVRHLLGEEYGDDLEELEGGGYGVPLGEGVRVWVVDGNHRRRRVLVAAPVLDEVEEADEILRVINELNAVTLYGRYFLLDDEVILEDTVLAEELQPAALLNAIGFVAWAADNARGLLAGERGDIGHGGLDAHAAANEVELHERTQPLGHTPTAATTATATGTVSAAGYL